MKKMTAAVRCKGTNETTVITSEYATKAAFRKDLNANGYEVVGRVVVEGENNAKQRRYEKGCRA
jgi:hypothetical protein